ncbi:hypothetical protein [Helicobacter canis]|uniref:hypothetical protein n=1 Tax=Helicobacter canis TaxID=29419 RepID=UPI0011C04704|nr:hypothetical protein [Helicobacter canis]
MGCALSFGLESWIASPRLCDRPPSLISARGSKSPDSSSKILPREQKPRPTTPHHAPPQSEASLVILRIV